MDFEQHVTNRKQGFGERLSLSLSLSLSRHVYMHIPYVLTQASLLTYFALWPGHDTRIQYTQ